MTIDCSFCAHANPDGAKFCNQCASPVHLRPCRLCDAVNLREAGQCYRCAAPLGGVAAGTQELVAEGVEASEQIVAQAGERLAALARDLGQPAPALQPAAAVEPAVAQAQSMAIDGAGPPEALPAEAAVGRADDPATRGPAYEPEIVAAAGAGVGPVSIPVSPDERQWRPERRSRAAAIVLALLLIAVPATVYLMRNPDALDTLLAGLRLPTIGRGAGAPPSSPAGQGAAEIAPAPQAAPDAGATSAEPASAAPAAADATGAPADAGATVPAPATPAAGESTKDSPPVSPPPTPVVEAPASEPASNAGPPAEPAGGVRPPSGPASQARTPAQSATASPQPAPRSATASPQPAPRSARAAAARPGTSGREAESRPSPPAARDVPPPAAIAGEAPPAAAPPPQRPCTEAVAALGLCDAATRSAR